MIKNENVNHPFVYSTDTNNFFFFFLFWDTKKIFRLLEQVMSLAFGNKKMREQIEATCTGVNRGIDELQTVF